MNASGQINFETPNQNKQQNNNEENQKLEDLIKKTQRVLLKISTIFPFDLFPDDIVINEDRVIIITREFFKSEQIYTIPINEIGDVFVDVIPFFATLKIVDNRDKENIISIRFLDRTGAIKARRIIEGLAAATKQQINLSKIDTNELLQKIEELGKVKGTIEDK